jgi:hypothetical protein
MGPAGGKNAAKEQRGKEQCSLDSLRGRGIRWFFAELEGEQVFCWFEHRKKADSTASLPGAAEFSKRKREAEGPLPGEYLLQRHVILR